jgi:hypothetical protein
MAFPSILKPTLACWSLTSDGVEQPGSGERRRFLIGKLKKAIRTGWRVRQLTFLAIPLSDLRE